MKKAKIFLFTIIIITAFSCNKDFLSRQPLDKVTPEMFFRNENDMKTYTNWLYSTFQAGGDIYEGGADDIVKSSVSAEISGLRQVPPTDNVKWNWEALRQINYFLNHPNIVNFSNTRLRDKYAGVAKFFRALFYFNKVKWYGDVPWYGTVIETNDGANLQKGRDSRVLIVDSIVADLDFAIANLDEAKSVERVTRWTALALKSRVCLYEGTWRKYHTEFNLPGAEALLNECVAASQEMISSGVYNLYTATSGPSGNAYQDVFNNLNIDPVMTEVIIARRYSNTLNLTHNLQFYMTSTTQGKPGLEKKLVNSYLMKDGSRFTEVPGYDTMQYNGEIQNRDPRLAQTIRTPGYRRVGATSPTPVNFNLTMTGYHPTKGLNAASFDGSSQSYQDLILFRYAEVLLNYAEAKAELGTLSQGDIDISIKRLRDRAGMPNLSFTLSNANPDAYQAALYKNVSGANKGVILEIRRERRIELVMENGLRWEDLMRWKEGHLLALPFKGTYFPGTGLYDLDKDGVAEIQIYSGQKPPAAGPYLFPVSELDGAGKGNILTNININKAFNENRDYLWPLPIYDLTVNPNLTQNPGWK
ncbi:RagB/SusD family nutrient uptake outer membrane protein [Niabella aquatica]